MHSEAEALVVVAIPTAVAAVVAAVVAEIKRWDKYVIQLSFFTPFFLLLAVIHFKRMKNLKQNQNLFAGEITPESIELDRRPLENYVKFYYEKLDEIEQILTENLQKICYALDLMEYFEDLKIEIEK